MRAIVVPEQVMLSVSTTNQSTGALEVVKMPLDFVSNFIMTTILHDPKWGKSVEWLHAAFDIKVAFSKATPGSVVSLTTECFAKLEDVVRNPTAGYNPVVMLEAMSFIDAVLTAQTVGVESK
jgi:hypothetical protein